MLENTAKTDMPARQKWWSRPFSNIQTNLQEIDATMSVDHALDFIEAQGADTWLLNVGGIESFYPTDLPFQARVPFLADRPSGDLVGDACEAAQKRNIRILARMDFSKVSARIAREHPEWLFQSPKGQYQVYNTLYSTCPCGDYYQERSLDIIDEVVSRYPVKGFFINWFKFSEVDYSRVYHGVCHCERCKTAFASYTDDAELPDGPQHGNYSVWLRFAAKTLQDLVDKIARHLDEKYPDVGLIMSRESPLIYYEANNALGRELWHHATSEAVSVYRTGIPESAVLVNSTCFVDMPYRMAGEQPEHFAQYLLQALARGGNPSTYLMGSPGRIPYPNLPQASEIQHFFQSNRDIYAAYRPSSRVALVRPDPLRRADADYGEAVSEYRGIYNALKEKHIPFDVVGAEFIQRMAKAGNLARYTLVVLPDIRDIGTGTADCLDTYVAAGGNLVLTANSGVTQDGSVELATAPSVMRIEAPKSGMDLWATYVAETPQLDSRKFRYDGQILPVFGSYARYIWKPTGKKLGNLLPQAPYGPPEKCYGHISSDEPGAVRLSHPAGSVLQFPWAIGRTYHEFGAASVRDYFLRIIDDLIETDVTADLPEQVEMTIGRIDTGVVIHLINQTGARRKSFGPHIPVSGATIRVRNGTGTPKLLKSRTTPSTRFEEDHMLIELPELELFEVLYVPTSQ
ncbi:beta-galactosidase trimerization domain-containing protein [Neorhizobium tomejilense]|uniref:beta-galactosidase trimerization domain-containing protein n=1 Tax=Neorhizobium tomejilense TaxID=2093828 RepID=UPI003ECC9097